MTCASLLHKLGASQSGLDGHPGHSFCWAFVSPEAPQKQGGANSRQPQTGQQGPSGAKACRWRWRLSQALGTLSPGCGSFGRSPGRRQGRPRTWSPSKFRISELVGMSKKPKLKGGAIHVAILARAVFGLGRLLKCT